MMYMNTIISDIDIPTDVKFDEFTRFHLPVNALILLLLD